MNPTPRNASHALYYQIFNLKPGRGEERKIKIVEAMIDCIATKGLEDTSFDTLGKMVKMKRTHVAYYFANRDELIQASVRYAVAVGQAMTIESVSKATNWEDRLTAVIEGPFRWLKKYPKHAAVMGLFYYQCTHNDQYRELQNSIRSMGEQRIHSCLEPALVKYEIADAEGKELARVIQSLMNGAISYLFNSDFPLNLEQTRTLVTKSAFTLLDQYAKNRRKK